MQKDGLVSRQPDRNDRRNNRIVLIENSGKIIQDVITYGEKLKNVILSNISQDELSITKKTLDKMWVNVQSKIQQELLFARMDGAEMPQRMNRSRIDG